MNQQSTFRSCLDVRWRLAPLFVACCLCLSTGNLFAVVTFDWVTVGDPNNPPDQLYPAWNPDNLRFGSVAYTYRISKYEVTNDQYVDFLNAVDATGVNSNRVYNSAMADPLARGGIDFNPAAANGSKYSSKINFGNKPVNYVSFFDAMRYVNWLENGQPTCASGGCGSPGGTESGVYTIGNGWNETRAPGATFFIPNEDEWYKAAYYQPASQGGDTDNYWLYATASNTVPTVATANAVGDISNPGTNVANYNAGADWNGQDGNVTTVGSAGAGSASFYGTFDQGGNVWEWNETPFYLSLRRGLRGGTFGRDSSYLPASARDYAHVNSESGDIGFRVASILGPDADFNDDGLLDCADVDSLVAEVVASTNRPSFDLTGDGLVNIADLDQWRVQGGAANLPSGNPYLEGDANLDGAVDGSDFSIWSTHKFTNVAAWCSGDFNASGSVDGSDFSIWSSNKFTTSATASTVPEPAAALRWLITCLALSAKRLRW